MQEIEIRAELHSYLEFLYKDIKDTIIVDEMRLCKGLSRIDVAVINGSIHGYEIKSEYDNLKRLYHQINYYNKSLEEITIVIDPKHQKEVIEIAPRWWGLLIAEHNKLIIEREARKNPLLDNLNLLELLWKNELLAIMAKNNIIYYISYPRKKLREIIFNELDSKTLIQEVREALKSRKNWRN